VTLLDSGSLAATSLTWHVARAVVSESGYARLHHDGTEKAATDGRMSGLASGREYTRAWVTTLDDFLEDVALVSDTDTRDDAADAPTLLTLHSAKGLEFHRDDRGMEKVSCRTVARLKNRRDGRRTAAVYVVCAPSAVCS